MKTAKVPTYGLHKPTGQARCYVNGKTVYLGKYGSEESRIRFGEIVGKLIGGQPIDPMARTKVGRTTYADSAEADPGPSVGVLCVVFLSHAEAHYVKDGVYCPDGVSCNRYETRLRHQTGFHCLVNHER